MGLRRLFVVAVLCAISGCGGGGNTQPAPAATTYSPTAGLAQKGPLILGSTVTAQELNATLAPTGKQYSYQTNSDLGTFNPNSTFTSQYVGVNASGYYFNETTGTPSTGPITLSAYVDLSATSVMNVNLLTTLAYKRIQHLVANSGMSFAAAQEQAENTVLAALGVAGDYGRFGSLDISTGTEGGKMLAAVSALFCQGNDAGNLAALIANIQQDIAVNGGITSGATIAALRSSAQALDATAVAAFLNQKYASAGLAYTAADISNWLDQDGDGLTGRYQFWVAHSGPTQLFTVPASVVQQNAGKSISVSSGRLVVNGAEVSGPVTIRANDAVEVGPPPGTFPTGVAHVYLLSSGRKLARVSFTSAVQSLVVTPAEISMPVDALREFQATALFSDGGTRDVTFDASWTSSTLDVASIYRNNVTGVWPGTATITATFGGISGSTTVTVTRAALESIAVTPNPLAIARDASRQLTATAHFADSTTANVTSRVTWSSANTSIATVTGGLVTGIGAGSTTLTATLESISTDVPVVVVAEGEWTLVPGTQLFSNHTATLLPDGRVFFALGDDGRFLCCDNHSVIYDSVNNSWANVAPAPHDLYNHATEVLPNGNVMIIGGYNGFNDFNQPNTLIYSVATNSWAMGASMARARGGHKSVTLNTGKILVVGGSNSGPPELYDPVAGAWTAASSAGAPARADSLTTLADGRVLVLAGSAATLYDPATDSWTAAAGMSTERDLHAAVLLANGKVLVIGGAASTTAEIYDPATDSWSAAASMSTGRNRPTATRLLNGTVLVVGAVVNSTEPAPGEIYNPMTNSWSTTPDMHEVHPGHTATLLPNGAVIVLGSAWNPGHAELYQ